MSMSLTLVEQFSIFKASTVTFGISSGITSEFSVLFNKNVFDSLEIYKIFSPH